jgi:hypothetical protein
MRPVLLSVLVLFSAVRFTCLSPRPSGGPPAPSATSSSVSLPRPPAADPWATASWTEAPLAWAPVPAAPSKPRGRADIGEGIVAVWGAGPDDVWVLGNRHAYRIRGGARLARLSVEADFRRVSGTSATDVWIAAGELLHTVDGGATFLRADPDPRVRRTDEVWASSASDALATVPFSVVHSGDGGRTWAPASLAITSEDDFRLRGSASDGWIVGYRAGPSRSTDGGLTWREEGPPPVADPGRQRFWVDLWSTGGWAWAATSDAIWVRPNAARWVRALDVTKVAALWASGPEDVWAVGEGGLILHSP